MKFFVGLITLGVCLSVEAGGTFTLIFTITVPEGVLSCDGKQPGEITVTKSIVEGEVSTEFKPATAEHGAAGRTCYAIPFSTLIKDLSLDPLTLRADGWKVECSTATFKKTIGSTKLTDVTVVSDVTAEPVNGEKIATVTPLGRKPFDLVIPLSPKDLSTFSRYVFISWVTLAK